MTFGTAAIDNFDVRTQLRQVQQRIGYCPQFDALIDRMTGREVFLMAYQLSSAFHETSQVLRMYARLRGVREEELEHVVVC